MKTIRVAIIAIIAWAVGPFCAFGQTYQPFQPRQHTSTLGTPRSFEQPRQPIRQYQPPPDVNIQLRPGIGDVPRAYDLNTGYELNVRPRSLGGWDVSTD